MTWSVRSTLTELYYNIVEMGHIMYIPRHIETAVERIAKRKPIVVLTGARQVGKSTMLKETFREVYYITMNRPLVRQSATENLSLFFQMYQPPIVIDEIQKSAKTNRHS